MIGEVIEHLNQVIEGMPYFTTVYPECELKNDNGKEQPCYYTGKWNRVKLADFGYTYWRRTGDVTQSEVDSFVGCSTDYEFSYPYRLFAMTNRENFPSDNAYSPDRLAATLVKAVTIKGGGLKRSIGARKLNILSSVYSVDSEKILSEELSGVNIKDYRHCDLVVAIDVEINITVQNNCIEDPCDYIPKFPLLLENYVALP